jgi:hypothetical protein
MFVDGTPQWWGRRLNEGRGGETQGEAGRGRGRGDRKERRETEERMEKGEGEMIGWGVVLLLTCLRPGSSAGA